MTIKLTAAEAALLTLIAEDSNVANRDGVDTQTVPAPTYFVAPIDDYVTTIPPGSDTEASVINSMKGIFASHIRYTGPISYAVSNTNISASVSTTQEILTTTAFNLEVPRTVQISVSGTCYSDTNSRRFDYWLELNGGSPQTVFKLFFNTLGQHQAFASSWIVQLPTGTTVISVKGAIVGAGNIVFDANDFVNLTLIG